MMNKIDFVAFLSVTGANPNGDPLTGNVPRMDRSGYGEMSAECIKRKIRNRMLDMGEPVVVVPNDRASDGYLSIQSRTEGIVGKPDKDMRAYQKKLCEAFLDVRTFGGTFAWSAGKKDKSTAGVSIAVRGPVTCWTAKSVDPVLIEDIQITKSTNGSDSDAARGSDTMGMRHIVEYGLYRVQGSVSAQLAGLTGFSDADAEILMECLRTLFINDVSSARPDGTMEVVKLFWFEHDCPLGQYSSAQVFRSVHADKKPGVDQPASVSDYDIRYDVLNGLNVKEIDGM